MHIGIDIRSTLKQKTGIGYYTSNLINSLAKIDKENRYYLYSKVKFFNPKKKLLPLPGKNFRHLVNRLGINPNFILKGLNIFHTSSYDLPRPKNSKLVLVVHDVIHKAYPEGHSLETIKMIDKNLSRILNETDIVIVNSETTRKDFLKFYNFLEDRVKLIYPGCNEDLFATQEFSFNLYQKIEEKYNIKTPFILFVGTLEPRKNIEGLIKAYKILKDRFNLEYKLVIVGMRGWLYENIFNLVEELSLKDDITFTGYVLREDLSYFYKFAEIFVYPSFYEGAGLPLLEAFSFGLPVVTSNTSSMAEIAGQAAILVNPYRSEEIAWAILDIIKNTRLREDLRQRGLKRAREFSWETTAKKTLEVFCEV